MRALIIEDEPVAQWVLQGLLREVAPGIEICGTVGTVSDTVAFLEQPANRPDLVFMDVELADGTCFDILTETDVPGEIIMTTAYDHYAVRAFEEGSVDYLLKPIEAEDLRRAITRAIARTRATDKDSLLVALAKAGIGIDIPYKKRILVPVGGRIHPIRTDRIAYFFSEESHSYLVDADGTRYLLDHPLDYYELRMNPECFFRVNRDCIAAKDAVQDVSPLPGNRYRLTLTPDYQTEVSRRRAGAFLKWFK